MNEQSVFNTTFLKSTISSEADHRRTTMKQHSFIDLNGTPTKVVTWGKNLNEGFSNGEELILCIPGNPGVTQFYETFLTTIYEEVKIPIWVVGHSGHEKPEGYVETNDDLYNYTLEGQINQKRTFIEAYIPKDVKIHLIGHSVGTLSILKLLKTPSIKSRVIKTYFMFPTIEHLAESTNGKFMTRIIKPIVPIILFLAWVFTILPSVIQELFIHIYMFVTQVERDHLDAIVGFVDPYILRNIFTMAYDQIAAAKQRPDKELMEHAHFLKCYYAKVDNWVPRTSAPNLKETLPDLDVEISNNNMEHSFVLWQSKKMGEVVAQWFKN